LKKLLNKKKKRAVFLDRDGLINKKPAEHDYIKNWKEFKFLPNVAKAIRQLNKDFLVIVISNQRGVGRGIMSKEDVVDIHNRMRKALEKQNATIDGVYFCPHNIEDNCNCRKPKPGLLLKAARDFKIDLPKSYMIGDDLSDVEAGKKVGLKTILIIKQKSNIFQKIKKERRPDYIFPDLLEAVKMIEKKFKN